MRDDYCDPGLKEYISLGALSEWAGISTAQTKLLLPIMETRY